jgi:hypothetical protein
MTAAALQFHGKKITVDGHTWKAPYRICDARVVGGRVILIYHPDARLFPRGKFHNMEAFTLEGQRLWTAEHPMPESDTADYYMKFMSVEPLVVWNFACYRCTIDPETGRISQSEFTK